MQNIADKVISFVKTMDYFLQKKKKQSFNALSVFRATVLKNHVRDHILFSLLIILHGQNIFHRRL